MKAQANGGCFRENGGPCRVCSAPPKFKHGDNLDFERAGWTSPAPTQEEAAVDRRAARRGKLAALGLVLLFVTVALARCAT